MKFDDKVSLSCLFTVLKAENIGQVTHDVMHARAAVGGWDSG